MDGSVRDVLPPCSLVLGEVAVTTLFLFTHCLTYCSVFKNRSERAVGQRVILTTHETGAESNVVIPKGACEKLEEAG
jgi:hypothetical protein